MTHTQQQQQRQQQQQKAKVLITRSMKKNERIDELLFKCLRGRDNKEIKRRLGKPQEIPNRNYRI